MSLKRYAKKSLQTLKFRIRADLRERQATRKDARFQSRLRCSYVWFPSAPSGWNLRLLRSGCCWIVSDSHPLNGFPVSRRLRCRLTSFAVVGGDRRMCSYLNNQPPLEARALFCRIATLVGEHASFPQLKIDVVVGVSMNPQRHAAWFDQPVQIGDERRG